jgi:ABC-type antimicrobial peptide transport system permease subunit
MALGAQPRKVFGLVVGQGLRLVSVGVALGIALALGLSRYLGTLLFEVTAGDPLTYVATSLFLIAVALAACSVPARRASRVEPMTALRYE